ncbi:MAG: cell division protein FtsZ [Chitinophagaceae bacterium]|nr:cell division protein FtsZ [Polaromonas sp.]
MSNLQIGLAVAGGLVLAAVVAHSAWAARKSVPKQATPEPLPENAAEPTFAADALSDAGQRHDPTFTDAATDARDFVANPFNEGDSGLGTLTQLTRLTQMVALEKKPGLDALIDVIAPLAIDHVVSGEAALAAMPSTRRAGSKPFAVEGLNANDGQWEFPAPNQRYSAFQCGVQLANRLGALNQIEYSEFVIKTQAFADAVAGEPEFPEMHDEVARARELDQFASTHDAQLSFTLRATGTAWSPGYVMQSAARLGFVAGSIPGRMVLPASQHGGAPLLVLAFDTQAAMAEDPEQTALREASLSLDVPQVPRAEQPFVRMRESAITLAASMGGVIIDDNGNSITLDAMNLIGSELEQLYDTLDTRDLAAGSVLARRLFS